MMLARMIQRHAPTLLTALSIVGVAGTTYLVAKLTPEANRRLEEAEEIKEDELTIIEAASVVIPVYAPAIVTGMSTVACIVGSRITSQRKINILAGGQLLATKSIYDYRKAAKKLYGEDADDNIRNQILLSNPPDTSSMGLLSASGFDKPVDDPVHVFYDEYSDQYWEATYADVMVALMEFSERYNITGIAYMSELYRLLGIGHGSCKDADRIGWSYDALIDDWGMEQVTFGLVLCDLGEGIAPVYALRISIDPILYPEDCEL